MPFKNPKPEYAIWVAMKQRCLNPSNTWYSEYGGRGITVCPEWVNSFHAFYEDMGKRPDGLSLERIDNDKGYQPSNCKWADKSTQSANQRMRNDNTTGHTGVYYNKETGKYFSRVQFRGKILFNKTFSTIEQALAARVEFILKHKLPHKIGV